MKADFSEAQCIEISPQRLLIALPDGRSWLTELSSSSVTPLPVSVTAARRSSLAAGVVEGAIVAGLTRTAPASTCEPCSLLRYIRWLVGNHAFAGQTPGLLRRAAERIRSIGATRPCRLLPQEGGRRRGPRASCVSESRGLRNASGASGPPHSTAERRCIRGPPSSLCGVKQPDCVVRITATAWSAWQSSAMTRSSEGRKRSVRRKSALFEFLRVHSNVGSDSAHAEEQLSLFESLSYSELKTVACAAFETAELLARQQLLDQTLSEEEIGRRLQLAGITVPNEERRV